MFSLHFIKPGIFEKEDHKIFTTLLDMRQDADYEDFIDYEERDVAPLIGPAKQLISHIGKYIAPFLD